MTNEENTTCWFCGKKGGDLFSTEFDTFFHLSCLRKSNINDPEYRIIVYEFKIMGHDLLRWSEKIMDWFVYFKYRITGRNPYDY